MKKSIPSGHSWRSRTPQVSRSPVNHPKSPSHRRSSTKKHDNRSYSKSPTTFQQVNKAFSAKVKMSETSLFAELVKDRNMRELALRKIAELSDKKEEDDLPPMPPEPAPMPDCAPPPLEPLPGQDLPDSAPPLVFLHNSDDLPPLPPDDDDDDEDDDGDSHLDDIKEVVMEIDEPSEAQTPPFLPPLPNSEIPMHSDEFDLSTVPPPPVPPELPPVEHPKLSKLSKLPLPPGINQNDLENIDSPPSRSPSPVKPQHEPHPPPKPFPPMKKSIKDLPLPPGMLHLYFNKCFISRIVLFILYYRLLPYFTRVG